jgi:TetR/AcrR family transcriptional regulator
VTESRRRGNATREAILLAAETVFAERGFDGARIDTIAQVSGYNKTLIFRYFGDKLGLYAAVLRRADREWSELLARLLSPLLEDESIVSDAHRFREFLKTTLESFFDYMVTHPRFMRIINWEQAEAWKTFTGIASQFEPDDLARLVAIFSKAQLAGLLRENLDITVMIVLVQQVCWSSPNVLPMYQKLLSENDSSATTLEYVRKQIIEFLIAGIIHDSGDRS